MSTIDGPNAPATLTDVPVLDPDSGKPAEADSIPLSFNAKRLRIQIKLTPELCQAHPQPPEDLVTRAQTKMQSAQADGLLSLFSVFPQRLAKAWARMQILSQQSKAPPSVTLTLAAGTPDLPGLDIKVRGHDDALVLLSIAPTADVAKWRAEWLELHIRHALRQKGITTKANAAQIVGVLARAQAGQIVRAVKIRPALQVVPPPGKSFQLAVNRARREISLIIHDLSAVQDVAHVNERLAKIEQQISGITRQHRAGYRIMRQELLEAINGALVGIEAIGLGMPMTLLAAVDTETVDAPAAVPSKPTAARKSAPAVAAAPATLLTINISDDEMTATVTAISSYLTSDPERLPSGDAWLQTELQRSGIAFGIVPEAASELRTRLATGESAAGLVVARGQAPAAGIEPYLHVLSPGDSAYQADVRAYRKRPLAKAGAKVAEIRCKEPGVSGMTVRGTQLAALLPTELPAVTLGEGMEQREPGCYYATFDGVVVCDGTEISLQKILVHEGDANLASGDIVFDGAVEIKGSVDSGARVRTGGDLIIHGDIRGGTVLCGGSLSVARGIVAGATGTIRAKSDVKADFIENSTVSCGGTLTVERSIMQSRVMAGGAIVVSSKSGLVGGGQYVCAQSLTTGNLGLPDGSKTELSVGSSYRDETSVALRQARLEVLTKKSEEDKRTYREITRKAPAQLSKVERSAKDKLRERVTRWGGIVEAARKHVDAAIAKQTFNGDAQIFVTGRLSTNCKIRLGGKAIPIVKEALAVVITTTEEGGSYVRPYSGDGDKEPVAVAEAPGPTTAPDDQDETDEESAA